MRVPAGFVKQADIAKRVAELERALKPNVESIRYSIDADWSGEPSIFFRIVLSDQASAEDKLAEVTERVSLRLTDALQPAELGLFPYFSFRSRSEQAALKDEAWS
jgi:hypothetical protein